MKTSLFNESYEDAMSALKDAEVKLSYYIQDPLKNHPSSATKTLYVKREDAEKAAKEGEEVSVWPGIHGKGKAPYDCPKEYAIMEVVNQMPKWIKRGPNEYHTDDDLYMASIVFVGLHNGYTGKNHEIGWQISKKNSKGEWEQRSGQGFRTFAKLKEYAEERANGYGYNNISLTNEERIK